MSVTAQDVADFVGQGKDAACVALAGEVLPVVTAMARAYTRGGGFIGGDPNDEVSAVITTASARLLANTSQVEASQTRGPFSQSVGNGFAGWSLAELFVLNRYRVRAL